jgi:hypothetical protein
MRIVMHVAIVLLLATPAVAQAQGHQAKDEKTKEEIQKLFTDLNDAITKRDRPRLEQLYADEFQFIRPSGGVINKVTQISGIMSNDPISSTPIPPPAIESLMVYGDVVVSRHTVRGTAVSSIFVKKMATGNFYRRKARAWRPSANQPHSILNCWTFWWGNMSLDQTLLPPSRVKAMVLDGAAATECR